MPRIQRIFAVAILACFTGYLFFGSHVSSLRGSLEQEPSSEEPATAPAMKSSLGVHVNPVSQAMRTQLQLPEGVGILIEYVVEDSGAADAGLKQYDVLHKLDDQVLINSAQLAVLVRMRKPDSKVTFSVIRDGKVMAVEVVLKAGAVTDQVTFDAFDFFHGHPGKQEMQNCAACHTGGENGGKDDGIHKSFDNYLFFHGTPGNAMLDDCSSCHVKSVTPLKIPGQTP